MDNSKDRRVPAFDNVLTYCRRLGLGIPREKIPIDDIPESDKQEIKLIITTLSNWIYPKVGH